MTEAKTGIVFKPAASRGGAQAYISKLAQWLESPVHVLFSEESGSEWSGNTLKQFGQMPRFPLLGRRIVGPLLDRLEYAFWTPPKEYDIVISSGLVTKAVQHHPNQIRIHLAHGFHRGAFGLPPRNSFSENPVVNFLQKVNRRQLRRDEQQDLNHMDIVVANSEFTASNLEHFVDTTADRVIPPPVPVSEYYNRRPTDNEFYLFLGRLAEVKGVGQIVKAFNKLPYQLKIAGEGPLREELEGIADNNIEFLGYVNEKRKRELLSTCRGFIQNSVIEDFGITTVEALASGAPVIAVNHQNNPYLVEDGKTGILFEPSESPQPMINAIQSIESTDWNYKQIQKSAIQYDEQHCHEKWTDLLNDISNIN